MFRAAFRLVKNTTCTLALASCLLSATTAAAQTDEERAGARAAAESGAKAFMERRWADAIDLFSRAESLVHSPVHLLYIARSHAKLGKLVSAREQYIKIINERLSPDAPDPVKEARAEAEEELRALEPRIPYVSVVVQGAGAKSVTVTMDGVRVPQALIGVPRPVDPGEHKFQAFAEGMESGVSGVTIQEGNQETVVLTLKALEGDSAPVAAAAPASAPGEAPPPQAAPGADSGVSEPGGMNGMQIAGWASLGVGAVGLGVGTVFGLGALSKRSDADDLAATCTTASPCSPATAAEVAELDDDASSDNTLSIVGFAVGGVGVAAGVTLLILGMDGGSDAASKPGITPWVGLGSAGMTGRF